MKGFWGGGGKGTDEWQHISIRVMIQKRRGGKGKEPDSIFDCEGCCTKKQREAGALVNFVPHTH